MTSAGRALWWIHTLTLLAFLPFIPHTKHLHLVLSPFTVFLKRGGFSKIPPLVGDEDFGMDTGKDITQVTALQAYSCVECGRCTEHCPANNTGKELNPKVDRARNTRLSERIRQPRRGEPIVGTHISQEPPSFSAPPAALASFSVRSASSILPIIIGLRRG